MEQPYQTRDSTTTDDVAAIDLRRGHYPLIPGADSRLPAIQRAAVTGAIPRDQRLEISVADDGQVTARFVAIGRR